MIVLLESCLGHLAVQLQEWDQGHTTCLIRDQKVSARFLALEDQLNANGFHLKQRVMLLLCQWGSESHS